MAAQITSLERVRAAIRFEEADRVPVFPLMHYATTRAVGMKISEFASNAESMAKALLAAYRRYGYDGICPGVDVIIEAEALGSETVQPDDAPAFVVKPAIQKYEDLDRLEVPADPRKTGRMAVVIKATEIVAREVGKEAYIGSWVMGPMNIASQLRGVEQLMFDIADNPAFFEALLDFSTEVSIAFGKALVDAGANMISMGEALCSPNFISPRTYRKYVLSRERRVHEALVKHGAETTLVHICGDVRSILKDAASIGAILDLDWPMDMAEAKKAGAPIRGNLDPARLLLEGSPEEVAAKAKEVLETAKAGGDLIFGTGCDVSPDTPAANIEAMMEAALERLELTARYQLHEHFKGELPPLSELETMIEAMEKIGAEKNIGLK
jgi:uroporphyrinogen decarboxylase